MGAHQVSGPENAADLSLGGLDSATLPSIPIDAALGQAVGVSLQLASNLAVFALIIFGIRKSFELSFGGKF